MEIQNIFSCFALIFLMLPFACHSKSLNTEFLGGFVDGPQTISIYFSQSLENPPDKNEISITRADGKVLPIQKIGKGDSPQSFILTIENPIDIKREYTAQWESFSKRLIMNKIYQHPDYFNLNKELGAIYSPTQTTFRLYAPRARSVIVKIYKNPVIVQGESFEKYELKELDGGIWEAIVSQNLAGKYYTYQLESAGPDCHDALEVVDPYAHVVTRGDGQSLIDKGDFQQTIGRGMIVDPARSGTVAPPPQDGFDISHAIIYETHVRDFSRDPNSGVAEAHKGLYSGAAQTGTRYKSYKTCIDHVQELGVTVVQLHPVNEFWVMDEQTNKNKYFGYKDKNGNWHPKEYYNWGYAPINYFSVEGWYATNPDDLSRIIEFKEMISAFHRQGIRVTLDVVFNHTFEGSRDNFSHWLFRGIDTDLYYRRYPSGQFCDGIFCGNEVNTENPMVARYIIDCLKYWVTEFKVDGFRFDWMSALDPETMNKMVRELRAINPNILLYGELWTLRNLSYQGKGTGTYVDRQHTALFEKDYNLPAGSIAGFNDYFRDTVKGSGYQRDYAGGYIQNTQDEIYYEQKPFELVRQAIKGMVDYKSLSGDATEWAGIRSPLNSLNYISCHDGYTLYDKLVLAAWCGYKEPGLENSPKMTFPQSPDNPNVVDFQDPSQFSDPNIEANLKKMVKFGSAILFTSQGIPFMHSGMELLRQKVLLVPNNDSPSGELYIFDSNSNVSTDATNAIRWALKEKNYDVFQYIQGLIKLRKAHPTFRRKTAESVRKGLKLQDDWRPADSEACIAYQILANDLKGEKWQNVAVLMNPYPEAKKFNLPKDVWKLVVNGEKSGTEILQTFSGGEIEVTPTSMFVLFQ